LGDLKSGYSVSTATQLMLVRESRLLAHPDSLHRQVQMSGSRQPGKTTDAKSTLVVGMDERVYEQPSLRPCSTNW